MSYRLEKFNSYAEHAWLNKAFKKLSKAERDIATDFIKTNDYLGKYDFELAINRMFIDKEKPKNFSIILELLACLNSTV
jgi:hypothetical protein